MLSLSIIRTRHLVEIALIGTALLVVGCPSGDPFLDGGSDGQGSDSSGLPGGGSDTSRTCLSNQVKLSDGTCIECSSWSCSQGEYMGSDGKCRPAPPECPNYIAGLPESAESADRLATSDVAFKVQTLGDGLAARQSAFIGLFPEIEQLLGAGDLAGQVLVDRFADPAAATADRDAALSLYAYVLGQIHYAAAKDTLTDFLRDNITGEVPDACSAVTHALRQIMANPDLPPDPTAYYLLSEMEATIAASQGYPYSKQIVTAKAAAAKECGREFYLIGADGKRIKGADGKDLKVGGTVTDPNVGSGYESTTVGKKLAALVVAGGGSYDACKGWTDPASGQTFENYPTNRFNCAGFAFRDFISGQRWRADPNKMFTALTASGALEAISESSAKAGDFIFFWRGTEVLPAHVGQVQTPSGYTGTTTVINADGYTGLFTAPLNSKYFNERYETGHKFYRWKDNKPPVLEVSTDRSQTNSCFGEDNNGDGWPDSPNCNIGKCIDPDFLPGYRVYMAAMYMGQLEVLPKGSEKEGIPACQFEGGGLDCTKFITVTPITDIFLSERAAVLSICPRITHLRILPLGLGPAAEFDGVMHYMSWAVYDYLGGCPQ